VHITPSLVFSDVTYIDSFRNTYKFYESLEVKDFIEKNKGYQSETNLKFYQQDYNEDIPEDIESYDIVISQYGGFVGQAVKKYLKSNGFLICNNSHGDASMASIDPDYKLEAVYNRVSDDNYSVSTKNLDEYLVPKKNIKPSKDSISKSMRGITYTKSPSGYIFKKNSS
jgi:hypothetical protein